MSNSIGASLGGALGAFGGPIGTAIGSGLGAIGGAFLSNKNSETPMQRKQRELVDDLLASLNGNGSFNDLFQADEGAFQRSFVDPAKARFRNQTAPQIQQSFIGQGQQRGTGLEDELTRAGVDMDSLLNQNYMNFQQGAQNRRAGAINSILGQGQGAMESESFEDILSRGAGGFASSYFGSDQGQQGLKSIFDYFKSKPQNTQQSQNILEPQSKGFES